MILYRFLYKTMFQQRYSLNLLCDIKTCNHGYTPINERVYALTIILLRT